MTHTNTAGQPLYMPNPGECCVLYEISPLCREERHHAVVNNHLLHHYTSTPSVGLVDARLALTLSPLLSPRVMRT